MADDGFFLVCFLLLWFWWALLALVLPVWTFCDTISFFIIGGLAIAISRCFLDCFRLLRLRLEAVVVDVGGVICRGGSPCIGDSKFVRVVVVVVLRRRRTVGFPREDSAGTIISSSSWGRSVGISLGGSVPGNNG